ncbi:MAG: PilZ domain-containing protein, partial [Candidatus Omnitrophica bacterium]|nr:PilZ domain-containing protein [Candidatus Omnitrophota bacterium]
MKLKDDNDVMKREDEMSFSDIAKIDRRITPRLEGNIYLLVEKQKGIVVNFNETGIAFLLNEPLKKDRFQGKFKVNPQTVSLDMEVIWKRKREGEKYFYGAKYTEINPGKIEKLRKEFILKKISTIMRTIDGLKNRKEIVKISREIAKYIVEVYLLSEKIDCCNVETKTADKILSDSTEKMMKKAEIFETKIKNKLLIKKTKNE